MTKFIAITDNSVWLVEQAASGDLFIEDRATFGSPYIEDGRRFMGPVKAGELKAGDRLTFENLFPNSDGVHDRPVVTGVINRVVAFSDEPAKQVPEGFIDITPGWRFLPPSVTGGDDIRDEALRALTLADVLVALVDMGRVTEADIRDANERIAR